MLEKRNIIGTKEDLNRRRGNTGGIGLLEKGEVYSVRWTSTPKPRFSHGGGGAPHQIRRPRGNNQYSGPLQHARQHKLPPPVPNLKSGPKKSDIPTSVPLNIDIAYDLNENRVLGTKQKIANSLLHFGSGKNEYLEVRTRKKEPFVPHSQQNTKLISFLNMPENTTNTNQDLVQKKKYSIKSRRQFTSQLAEIKSAYDPTINLEMASNNQRSFVEEGIPFTSELPNEKIKGFQAPKDETRENRIRIIMKSHRKEKTKTADNSSVFYIPKNGEIGEDNSEYENKTNERSRAEHGERGIREGHLSYPLNIPQENRKYKENLQTLDKAIQLLKEDSIMREVIEKNEKKNKNSYPNINTSDLNISPPSKELPLPNIKKLVHPRFKPGTKRHQTAVQSRENLKLPLGNDEGFPVMETHEKVQEGGESGNISNTNQNSVLRVQNIIKKEHQRAHSVYRTRPLPTTGYTPIMAQKLQGECKGYIDDLSELLNFNGHKPEDIGLLIESMGSKPKTSLGHYSKANIEGDINEYTNMPLDMLREKTAKRVIRRKHLSYQRKDLSTGTTTSSPGSKENPNISTTKIETNNNSLEDQIISSIVKGDYPYKFQLDHSSKKSMELSRILKDIHPYRRLVEYFKYKRTAIQEANTAQNNVMRTLYGRSLLRHIVQKKKEAGNTGVNTSYIEDSDKYAHNSFQGNNKWRQPIVEIPQQLSPDSGSVGKIIIIRKKDGEEIGIGTSPLNVGLPKKMTTVLIDTPEIDIQNINNNRRGNHSKNIMKERIEGNNINILERKRKVGKSSSHFFGGANTGNTTSNHSPRIKYTHTPPFTTQIPTPFDTAQATGNISPRQRVNVHLHPLNPLN